MKRCFVQKTKGRWREILRTRSAWQEINSTWKYYFSTITKCTEYSIQILKMEYISLKKKSYTLHNFQHKILPPFFLLSSVQFCKLVFGVNDGARWQITVSYCNLNDISEKCQRKTAKVLVHWFQLSSKKWLLLFFRFYSIQKIN